MWEYFLSYYTDVQICNQEYRGPIFMFMFPSGT